MEGQPHLYTDLAPWFHLLTAPEDSLGLFSRSVWFELLAEVGFVDVRSVGTGYRDDPPVGAEGFAARKPG